MNESEEGVVAVLLCLVIVVGVWGISEMRKYGEYQRRHQETTEKILSRLVERDEKKDEQLRKLEAILQTLKIENK